MFPNRLRSSRYSHRAKRHIYKYKPLLHKIFNDIMNIRLVISMLTKTIALCVYLGWLQGLPAKMLCVHAEFMNDISSYQ